MKVRILLFNALLSFSVKAQEPVTNLIFEGAGIRGIAYSGAITELEKKGILKDVKRTGGTSAGAITALLLSLGYTAEEITEIVNSTSFKKFNDGKYLFIGGISRSKNYYGWYRGQQVDKWISRLIEAKTGNPDISFSDLKTLGYKDLYVTGTCLNRQKLIVFSRENYPKMKVKDAVRISMTIPLYFEAVFINREGTVIDHPKNKTGLDIMADGGLTANFPIRMFDSTKYTDTTKPNQFSINRQTIGFRIDRDEQIRNDADGKGLAEMPISNISDYFGAFYNIVLENLNRQTLTHDDWQRTISISDGNISARIRRLPVSDVKLLVENGSSATRRYLSNQLSLRR